MNVRKAIFDKRVFGKKTIMALYATKKAFSEVIVFGDYVQNPKKYLFGQFFQREESRFTFCKGCAKQPV